MISGTQDRCVAQAQYTREKTHAKKLFRQSNNFTSAFHYVMKERRVSELHLTKNGIEASVKLSEIGLIETKRIPVG